MTRHEGSGPRRIVVISDFCDGSLRLADEKSVADHADAWRSGARGDVLRRAPDAATDQPAVIGGYLERLPLAAIRAGLCDVAEIWTFWARESEPPPAVHSGGLVRRSFRADPIARPFMSNDMLGFITAFGAPDILCVWGLGVDAAIMHACRDSVRIYNSIDAPALRIPPEISRQFDLVLTGAEWQSSEVVERHPGMRTAILPIGPEFASPETFFPLSLEKPYDVIYVAAAQAYKRHEILFNALHRMPRSIRALCVFGYGEMGDNLRTRASALGIGVDFIGPPGVDFAEVNRLMNLAKIGVVCGVDDGAPAIITEYMLAGLPVLANAQLKCGLRYIVPETGRTAAEEDFPSALADMLGTLDRFRPRETVLANWTWQHSIEKLSTLLANIRRR